MPLCSVRGASSLLITLPVRSLRRTKLAFVASLLVASSAAVLAATPAPDEGMAMAMPGTAPSNMSGSVPAGVTFGRMMPAGSVMVTYMPGFMGMSGNMIGTRDVSPQTIVTTVPAINSGSMMGGATQKVRIVPTGMSADMQMFGAMYAISDVVNVVAMGSWVDKSMTMTTFAGMMGTRVLGDSTGSTDGFGDLSISGLIRLYQDPVNHLHLNLGLSLPTGSNTETVTMLSVMNTNMTMRAPYGMQLGTGTFDGLIGLTYTGVIDRWSWGAAWRSRIPLDDNAQGYHFGAWHQETAWAGLRLWPGIVGTMRVAFTQQAAISGQDPAMMGLAETINPAFYGGDRIDLLGGLEIRGETFGLRRAGFSIEAGAPVYQRLNGPQLSRDWQVDLALTYAF